MKRFKCLLLDANVVIELFKLGLWEALVKQCDIHLSEIVVSEALYYEDSAGNRSDIDLTVYINSGQICVFSHSPAELLEFRASFDSMYLEKLDPGETESLIHVLLNQDQDLFICSADAIVFRVLGNLKLTEKGISLEEVFGQFKWQRKLDSWFTEKWRRQWSQTGLAESLYGGGKKSK